MAINTFASGVVVGGIQHCLVVGRVQAGNQSAAPLEDWNPALDRLGCDMWRAKAKLQSFLDQSRQTDSLPRSQRLGVGQQRIVDVERDLHGPTMQISV